MTNEQVEYVMNNHWTMTDTLKGFVIYNDDGSVTQEFIDYCQEQGYI